MASTFQHVYDKLPVFAQNWLCGYVGRKTLKDRYGPRFSELLCWLNESQWWSWQRLRDYQDQQLRRLVRHAYDTVPLYNRLMKRHGVTPKDVQSVEDLSRLPVIDKHVLRSAGEEAFSSAVGAGDWRSSKTGGTTGAGLHLRLSHEAYFMQWAVWWRHRGRFGLELGDRHANFAGQSVVPASRKRPPFWREVRPLNQTYFSVFHMDDRHLADYADRLEVEEYRFFSGYPSAIATLAEWLLRHGRRLKRNPALVVPGSESVFPHQAELFEQAFGAATADQYGMAEGCANLSQCEHFLYHEDMEFAVIEPLKVQDTPEGPLCRIVGTALHNYAMPIIRYEMGDLATYSDRPCACGRHSPVAIRVDGRADDYILTPDGRRIGRLPFFKDMVNIVEAQVRQERPAAVRILVVPAPQYGSRDEDYLVEVFRRHLGPEMQIDVERVAEVPRTASGKQRLVVSELAAVRARQPGAQTAKNRQPPNPEPEKNGKHETGPSEPS